MSDTIEGEATEVGHELEVRPGGPVTLFGTDDPDTVIQKAGRMADALMGVVRSKKLSMRIGKKEYLLVEAWTCLGSLVGVFPRTVWSREIENGWEARVEAVTLAGAVVGAAEAECLRSEKNWMNRDDYALRSMAQTRAMGKALRMPLGFIAVLAGYEATPAEEMPETASAAPSAHGDEQPSPKTASSPAAESPGDGSSWSSPGDVRIPAGKHEGQSIRDVYRVAPGYIEGVARASKDETVKAAAQAWLVEVAERAEDPSLPF